MARMFQSCKGELRQRVLRSNRPSRPVAAGFASEVYAGGAWHDCDYSFGP